MKDKPTIGLLIEGISGPYQAGVWPGIADTARSLGVGCNCYCGGALDVSPQNKWEFQRNALFDLAQSDRCDGYIISGSIGGYVPRERFMEFIDRFRGRPLVSLIPIIESIPAVYVDNRKGTYDLVTHLIRDHGYKSFAFIQGPEGNAEAQERFLLFKGLLSQHNLSLPPEAIIKGDFTRECGRKAVDYLLDNRIHVDAIVAAADEIALGALQTLMEKGVRVPKDMALVGFDDIAESGVITPPLTTVSQPMFQLGKKTVELLVRYINGEVPPPMTVLDATLMVRQSCGCHNPSVQAEKLWITSEDKPRAVADDAPSRPVDAVLACCDPAIRDVARTVVEAFFDDVSLLGSGMFLNEVNAIGTEILHAGLTEQWRALFLELWKYGVEHFDREHLLFADKLLHGSSIIRVDIEKRFWTLKQIKVKEKNQLLRMLGQRISNTLDIDLLLDVIALRFPQIGIKTFFILFYDQAEQKKSKLEVKLSCVNGQRVSFSAGNDFSLRSLATLMDDREDAPVFVAEGLYFQNERYGCIVFEVESALYELTLILPEYISSALHSIFLLMEVRRQTAVLSEANAELEKLRAKEHDLLEKINRELEQGRKIQRGFLPQKLPDVPGWEIAASFVPARAVSGDFYDTFLLGEKTMAFVIADVCGKDVSAALFMALICTLIRIHSERIFAQGGNPLDAVAIINDYIMRHYSQTKERQMYTTIFFGLLDVDRGVLNFCNAGHYAPVLVTGAGAVHRLEPTGPAVGLIEGVDFKTASTEIPPEGLLCTFTDGVTDARDPQREQFTFNKLFEIIKWNAGSASEKLKQIETALSDHIQGAEPSDDITILVLRRKNMTV
jgi:phosphoserine phosphatase RsbU/P